MLTFGERCGWRRACGGGLGGGLRHRADEAATIMASTGERWTEAETLRIAGEIALLDPKSEVAKAEAYFNNALSVARRQQAKSWELRAAMSMARLWRGQGKRDAARELLAPVPESEWHSVDLPRRCLPPASVHRAGQRLSSTS
jgi:predicted ATPase